MFGAPAAAQSNGLLTILSSIILCTTFDIFDVNSYDVNAYDVNTCDVNSHDVNTDDVNSYDVNTCPLNYECSSIHDHSMYCSVQLEIVYREQLSQLNTMGFTDAARNIQALTGKSFDIDVVIDMLNYCL